MDTFKQVFPVLTQGMSTTILVLLGSALIGYTAAFIAGLCRSSKSKFLRFFTGIYVEFFRGTSLIVQLFWLYYAFPVLFDIHLASDFWVAALAIGLNYGAYMSEIVRGSIFAVHEGQSEASIALNMSRFQRMRIVILPQAIRMMLPEFGNYLIQMLKATSLVSLIGLHDILYHGNTLRNTDMSLASTIYLFILVFYFVLAIPLIWIVRRLEGYSKKGVASE